MYCCSQTYNRDVEIAIKTKKKFGNSTKKFQVFYNLYNAFIFFRFNVIPKEICIFLQRILYWINFNKYNVK